MRYLFAYLAHRLAPEYETFTSFSLQSPHCNMFLDAHQHHDTVKHLGKDSIYCTNLTDCSAHHSPDVDISARKAIVSMIPPSLVRHENK
jgi:hypothetical protein